MAYEYSELLAMARDWAQTALAQGHLKQQSARELFELDARGPEQLFDQQSSPHRPLIVAFIGGTGVGKSSLLNRLAGQAVARAGIERPTSREVTLYHHRSLQLGQLPASLPLEKTKIAQHDNAQNQHIVWIDMPDFDSIELGNKTLVLEWLPHIDVLLYVVSPERYRDNKAWQLLRAEGGKHAWIFVMNQWDRAVPSQLEDFKQQLGRAGFSDPLVLYTSCSEPANDRFPELLEQLAALSSRQTMHEITQHNRRRRLQDLEARLRQYAQQLAGRDYAGLRQHFSASWQQAESTFQQGLAWAFHAYADAIAGGPGAKGEIKLWDAWAQTRVGDILEDLLQQADQRGISSKALKPGLDTLKSATEKAAAQQIELAARQALINPGNRLQRSLLRLTGICETLLPISAMLIVGYQVFSGYYHSAADSTAYLGVDFAVHSSLLIGLSWLLPFFLHRKLQPSLRTAALAGLNKGLLQVLSRFRGDTEQVIADSERAGKECLHALRALIEKTADDSPFGAAQNPLLNRVLIR
ncbi:GTPase domain-containing protein [Methylomonas sp. SURF-2]|uniref:GTPase domain-containing protein n=1 Tax=Methylomonas subterranea TaxID=2952225 RepID=A0ABT1TJQ7_9GAMM|nr:GTPase domain-containing protein [Methylomonas sp. SURF-2]MCQ8105704.1 GTPase domain-containing protein [Methylomonas sp. SURF-2]